MELKKKFNNEALSNYYAERGILNILLTNGQNIALLKESLPTLNSNCFYYPSHKLIYETICELFEKNLSINMTTILSTLQNNGTLKKIGGIEEIVKIVKSNENFLDINEYIRIVNEIYIRRSIINLSNQYKLWGLDTSLNINQILSKIEESFFELNKEKIPQKTPTAEEIVEEIFDEMKKKKKDSDFGFKTSYTDFDAIIQGFQKSDLIIIAGRPSMGKTAFSLNLGKNIVEKYKIPLIIFTLEMSRQQIIYRFISSDSNINNNRIKSGKMTLQEIKMLTNTMEKISKMPIFIDDSPNLSLLEIRAKIQKIFNSTNQTGLVIIDYLQLMKLNLKLENRVQEISYITRNLKLLAKEFNIPILLLSQLSRNVESRVNKRPMLSDLRDSGCISFQKKKNLKSWNLRTQIRNHLDVFEIKGLKPIYLIFFKNGVNLHLTSTHKILSENGWIKMSELTNETKIYSLLQKKSTTIENYQYNIVESILFQGVEFVFDKTIPNFHNYVMNNLILHNSIEQDADIVIMLYRDDYYNEKNIQSQITEFIIAKHRNGPIGTAKLLFDSTTTSFKNISKI